MTRAIITPAPTYGHPIARDKPFLWVTWLSKLLGGTDICEWSAWFKAHYRWQKLPNPDAASLQTWNAEHAQLMRDVRSSLEQHGWTCTVEDANSFTLRGRIADVAGTPDLVGVMPGQLIVVDGKTGAHRDSDWWQVVIYLYALSITKPELFVQKGLPALVEGEVVYYGSSSRIDWRAVSPATLERIIQLITTLAGSMPPPRTPSRRECRRCPIAAADCPDRFREDDGGAVVTDRF